MSLTADIWSANNKSYLGMTAKLLNEDLKWKSYALACSRFKGSHTYDRIAEQLNGVFARYKIAVDKKIQGALTNNTSKFSKAFREYPMVSDEDVQVSDEENEDEAGMAYSLLQALERYSIFMTTPSILQLLHTSGVSATHLTCLHHRC